MEAYPNRRLLCVWVVAIPARGTETDGKVTFTGDAVVRIAWAMPAYGPIFPQVYNSHIACIAYASRELSVRKIGDFPMMGATDRMYLHSASNLCVEEALKVDGITHIFWTESDMILPNDTITKLLAVDKAIVSGVYFLRGGSGQPCLFAPTPFETKENPYLHTPIKIYDERGPFKLAKRGGCPGMGCVLISTEVFKRIEPPWFDLKANDPDVMNGYGQDLYFYTKVRWAGFEVWAEPGVICDQIDTTITGYSDYRRRLDHGKAVGEGGFIALDASGQS